MRRWPRAGGLALAALALTAGCSSSTPPAAPPGPRPVVRPSAAQAQRCAATPSTWMGCLVRARPGFGHTQLSQVSLPGSLNAATANLDPQAFDVAPHSPCTEFTRSMVPEAPVVARWYGAQDESLTEQLDQGVRFLDLQVAFNGTEDPLNQWRVVNTLFSSQPLEDYLSEIATWAEAHPSEVVVLDFRNVCYNTAPPEAVRQLWADLGAVGSSGTTPLSHVMFDASGAPAGSLGAVTLDDVVHQDGGGHNVVLVVPASVADRRGLAAMHLHPFFASPPGGGGRAARGQRATVAFTLTAVAPAGGAGSPGAAAALARIATGAHAADPPIGSLAGTGLYVSPVAYDLGAVPAASAARQHLYDTFGGLVTASGGRAPWEAPLWPTDDRAPTGHGAPAPVVRVLGQWGHGANVVAADAVERSGLVLPVIVLNARTPGQRGGS